MQDLRVGGRQSNATYQYTLEADSLADLKTWATKLTTAMQDQPDLEDVNSDQQDHGLQSYITIDRDKAAQLGLTNSAIDNTLYDAFGQRTASVIYEDVNQYYVVMEVAPQYQQDPMMLKDVYISRQSVASIPAGQAAAQGVTPIGIPSQLANVTPSTQAAAVATGLPPAPPPSNVTPSTQAAAVATGFPPPPPSPPPRDRPGRRERRWPPPRSPAPPPAAARARPCSPVPSGRPPAGRARSAARPPRPAARRPRASR